MFSLAFFVLYACVQTQQAQPVKKTVIPPPPAPYQAPPSMGFQTYSGKLSEPDGFPEPGPPYTRKNSDPHQVLRELPTDDLNLTDWVKSAGMSRPSGDALYSMDKAAAVIKPHESLDLKKPSGAPFNFNIDIPAIGAMPDVVFPHFPHSYWLDCANCHPSIFIMKKGANPISMVKITNGEYCGRCHGRIAFPLAECNRCHVKPKK